MGFKPPAPHVDYIIQLIIGQTCGNGPLPSYQPYAGITMVQVESMWQICKVSFIKTLNP
jgi:hypothetical protein